MKGILIEYVRAVRRALGVLLLAIALALGSLGIWTMATKDVQGGRHEAGAMTLGVAVIAAIAAAALLVSRRRG
jgi:Kef-type K+ transport system membrane component KefB